MSQRANVTSAEAIEAFRARLIVYVSKARPALEEVSADVQRTRVWLENDQRIHWEFQVRQRAKALEQAQAELFSARISNLSKETATQQIAFHRARRALDEANDKLRVVKRWAREFDGQAQPLVKQMEKLHTLLSHDLVQAIALLGQITATLAAYAEIKAPSLPAEPPAAGTASTVQTGAPAAGQEAK